jgi:hypothetical protein
MTDKRLIERFGKIASTALTVDDDAGRAELIELNKELDPDGRMVMWVVSGRWHYFELVETVTGRTLIKRAMRATQSHEKDIPGGW